MLLFVVSGDTLSVATLVEVAYFIGQGRRLVLCLNDIPQSENPVVDGIKVGGTHLAAPLRHGVLSFSWCNSWLLQIPF